jgi:uncharacterized membrane protein YphA (DoxX/SURF4 family)
MTIALWIIQGLLALAFLVSGVTKLTRPRLALARQMAWVQDFDDFQVKGIGVLEVLAAIGLVVPPLLHVGTFLAPLAAVGIVLLMLGAAATHLRRREPQMVVVNMLLLVLALIVAIGRFGPLTDFVHEARGHPVFELGVMAVQSPSENASRQTQLLGGKEAHETTS